MKTEKQQVYKGVWWFPTTPENRVTGTLVINDDKIELDFQGEISRNPSDNVEIIQGIDLSGRPITLQYSFLVEKTIVGVSAGKFQVQVAYLGEHFAKSEEIIFQTVNVSFDNLSMWASQGNLKVTSTKNGTILIRHKTDSDIKIKLPSYNLSIQPSVAESWSLIEAHIKEEPSIFIAPEMPISFNSYMKIIRNMQNFFTLAMNYPTYPISIWATSTKRNFPIHVHMNTQDFGTRRDIFWAEMLFTLRDTKQNIKSYIREWLLKAETLEPVTNLFFSTFYNPRQYLESTFLSLIQAVETYHRIIWRGTYQPEDDFLRTTYLTLVNSIPLDINQDFKNSLKSGRLRYAYEYSLRKRLQEICQRLHEEAEAINCWLWFVASKEAIKSFVEDVVNTRNYLTHHTQELKSVSKDGQDLYNLTMKLRLLLQISLLRETGMNFEEIMRIIREKRLDRPDE